MKSVWIFAILVAMILFSCLMMPVSACGTRNDRGQTTCIAPVSAWSASVTSGASPLKVQFTSTSTGTNLVYQWYYQKRDVLPANRTWVEFSENKNPVYKFSPGEYDIRLNVSNKCGVNSSQHSNWIRTDKLPTVAFSVNQTKGNTTLGVKFSSANSTVPSTPGEIIYYMWKYKTSTSTTWKIFSEAANPTLTLPTGIYDINLMITNDGGSVNKTQYGYIVVR